MQTATPLSPSVPLCGKGHKPQLVMVDGAPAGHRLGEPCPSLFHIECHRCNKATIPAENRAIAELRWTREDTSEYRIPISHLGRYRAAVLASMHGQVHSADSSNVLQLSDHRRQPHGRTAHAR